MPNPLNPGLYDALEREFGSVTIANEGCQYVGYRQPSMYRRGKWDTPAAFAGEYYRVSCWQCNDTRQRLWVNHMFGVVDEGGDDHLYLAHCFNESCVVSRDVQMELFDRLFPFNYNARRNLGSLRRVSAPVPQPVAPVVDVPVALPSPLLPLHDPSAARACDYLHSRGFSPSLLAETYGIAYCPESHNPRPAIHDRLVIPIYTLRRSSVFDEQRDEGVLAGWQARALYETNQAKYLTMKDMAKSNVLYGLPQAKRSTGPVVVTEGVTDVWRLRHNAVASLGKTVSERQCQLILQHFGNRPIVVLFDRDAAEENHVAAQAIRRTRRMYQNEGPVIAGQLPDGRDDAGDCSHVEVWAAVWASLQGIVVP